MSIVHSVAVLHAELHISRNNAEFCLAQNICSIKKAAELLNFCLIGKILHNFPMPISIEPAPKTFLCIQMLLSRRVSVKCELD